jgi:putative peptidoglycan lipid II flippase
MNLLKALATVSGLTLLSRMTGLVRDTLMARSFGVSAATDAFVLAFTLPNLLRRLFAEGAFAQAFVPILGEYKNQRGDEATHTLVDQVATLLAWALAGVTLLGVIGAPLIVSVVAPGFAAEPGKAQLTTLMLRIMFPYLFLVSLVALAGGILNTWSRFAVPAFTPVLLNICMIGAMLGLSPHFDPPPIALAIGVSLGGVAQLLFQVPALLKLRLLPRMHFNVLAAWREPGVRRVVRQMGPAVLGVSIAQLSLIINRVFQSFLETGSMSWLYSAERLMEFPTALLGVALGTVLMPTLSKASSSGDRAAYSNLLDWGLRLACLLALPAAVGLIMLATPLVATLFHYGAYSVKDVTMSAHALMAYAAGLMGLILVKVLAPGFYAQQDIRTPVRIGLLVLVLTQVLNLMFIGRLAHAGLALAISIAACVNAALLFRGLRKRGFYEPQPGWPSFLLRMGLALALLATGLGWVQRLFDWTALQSQAWWRIAALAGIVIGGAALYFASLLVLGFRLNDFRRRA